MSNNNNTNDYAERERKVIELYEQNKSTRYIAESLRMSLRDIDIILNKHGLSHGIALVKDNGNDNNSNSNRSHNEKATQAYELYDKGNKPVQVAIQLGLSEREATRYYTEYWRYNESLIICGQVLLDFDVLDGWDLELSQ